MILPYNVTQVQVAVNIPGVASYYLICYSKTILKPQVTIHPRKIPNFLEMFS